MALTIAGVAEIASKWVGSGARAYHVSLHVAAPGSSSSEVSGGSYARVQIAAGGWTVGTSLVSNNIEISNTAAITFTGVPATTDITHVALNTGASSAGAGQHIVIAVAGNPDPVAAGQNVRIAANALKLKFPAIATPTWT